MRESGSRCSRRCGIEAPRRGAKRRGCRFQSVHHPAPNFGLTAMLGRLCGISHSPPGRKVVVFRNCTKTALLSDRMPMPSTRPILKLLDLIQSHRVTAVIYVAAKLGIAEFLRAGPQTLDELAKATGSDKDALGRLLTALSTLGICSLAGEDRYCLTEMGAGLDGDTEHSFKHWAIFEGEMLSKSWNGMLES